MSILNSADFLLQLNCVELLTQLAICSHGQIYLEIAGVMNKLGIMLNDCPNMPFADIIMPGKYSVEIGVKNDYYQIDRNAAVSGTAHSPYTYVNWVSGSEFTSLTSLT